MKNKEIIRKKGTGTIFYLIFWLLFEFALILGYVAIWTNMTFHAELEEIFFTIRPPLDGADGSYLSSALRFCVPRICLGTVLFTCLVIFCKKRNRISFSLDLHLGKHTLRIPGQKLLRSIVAFFSVAMLLATGVYAQRAYNIIDYIKVNMSKTKVYENYYVDPDSVVISATDSPKNLLCIYLESMEVTYASREQGGQQDVNYIPNLTQMAFDNVSFGSGNGVLGGSYPLSKTAWTTAALLGTTSGVPFHFPLANNELVSYASFASNLKTIGTVLEKKGYNQEFICGSDASFGGRRAYFAQHGNYEIFDYYTAMDKGYIEPGYKVWWGFEDSYLFEIAKDEIQRLAALDAPFNLTMLTVDTHNISGYVCPLCDTEKYDDQLAVVLDCADHQVQHFIDWVKEQDFYEDTAIVILGDHPRIDEDLVAGVPLVDRKVYNCFINSSVSPVLPTETRQVTQLDMFPTMLAAMGYEIEGDRLGLGTNLFSDLPTMVDILGYETFNSELCKQSDYYRDNFY